MKFQDLGIYLLLFILLTGCSTEASRDSLPYQIITEGHLSYSAEEKIPEQTRVFTHPDELEAFLEGIENVNPHRAQYLRELQINFSRDKLVIIIGEFFNYCCSSIIVKGIYEEGNKVLVEYTETDSGEAAALSQAYMVITVPK